MIIPAEKLVPHTSLEAYVFDPTGQDWGKLLAPYSPPLPREGQVILASYFGDVFVEEGSGAVWWVNGLEARVDRIAKTRDDFITRIDSEHLPMLKTKLMEALIVQNRLLKTGMLYGLKRPRSEGGGYETDNVGTAPIADAFAFMGAEFKKKSASVATMAGAKAKKKGWFH